MLKAFGIAAALIGASAADAQGGSSTVTCPAGTHYATIRHSRIKTGQGSVFDSAVAAHNAWYASHRNGTRISLERVLRITPTSSAINPDEAVTITRYDPALQPAHDAGYTAFTDKYRASSEIIDEARICLR